ncbi:MAG: oxidoreductase [Acidobacteria bacterium]|nr:oxidoreductase [Acidobacteriota bacterium]
MPRAPSPRRNGRKPRLAVFKLASCDGCQLTLLDCEDELLAIAGRVEVAYFPEASRAMRRGPYDIALVEGSVTTPHDAERILGIRKSAGILVSLGACATAGGIQALRNFADVGAYVSAVYATPEYVTTLAQSTPVAQHVRVDFELRGCPIAKDQLLELLTALLAGRRPALPTGSVCQECKRRGAVCVMVARGTPCLGPVTQAGCGALCPAFDRGCFGCFGPMESPNAASLGARWEALGVARADVARAFRTFNAGAPAFRAASEAYEREADR